MQLFPYSEADLGLTEELECDPVVMRELGGAVAPEEIPAVHHRRLHEGAPGDWWLTIAAEGTDERVGVIGIWRSSFNDEPIHEVGWMVLPRHQGKGIAGRALALLLERARAEPRLRLIHAFPGASNAPSNALCARAGFTFTGRHEIHFRERPLTCNHWELEVG